MPAAAASSTGYWMTGLSTIGSISFGLALVTGRKRLPRPATGKTAFLSFILISLLAIGFSGSALPQRSPVDIPFHDTQQRARSCDQNWRESSPYSPRLRLPDSQARR